MSFSMSESAIAAHEMFVSYLDAGFDENQALFLVVEILKASIQAGH